MSVTNELSKVRTEAGLQCLHECVVEPDHIDQLGHMNVRFYGAFALGGVNTLINRLGLPQPGEYINGQVTGFTDLYTRHYREQLAGAPLEVWGGVLDIRDSELRVYTELVNPERGELAATFVHVIQLRDADSQSVLSLAHSVRNSAQEARVAWPEHGRPRSVDLDRDPYLLSLREAQARNLASESDSVRIIRENECDSNGFYISDSFLNLVWGPKDVDDTGDDNWLKDLGEGRMMGWATMESRGTFTRLPRVGTRIQGFGAVIEIGRKIRHERSWVYDMDSAELLCTASIVNVAFDIAARQAIVIPADELTRLKKRFHPDLL